MEKLTLTQSHAPKYFQNVFEKEKSGEQFPVDLDEVWPLIYARKDVAVRELKKNFYEDEDFSTKMRRTPAGKKEKVYFLSVSCLEHLVVRKKREVFEVYRTLRQKYQSGDLTHITEDEKLLLQKHREAKFFQQKYITEREDHKQSKKKLLDTEKERDRYEDALYDEMELRRIAHRWFPNE